MDVTFTEDRTQRQLRAQVQDRWSAAPSAVRHLDPVLIAASVLLAACGLLAIYSAKVHQLAAEGLPTDLFVARQAAALVVGVVGAGMVAALPNRWLRSWSWAVYACSLLLLLLVLTPLGVELKGARSWLGAGPLQFQPAELAKIGLVLAAAAVLHLREGDEGPAPVLMVLGLLAPPLLLIVAQPDPGTGSVLIFVAFALLLVGGTSARWLLGLLGVGLAAAIAVLRLGLLAPHQVDRLTAFVNPDAADLSRSLLWNTDQSQIAIGSGQLTGKGLFGGTQTELSFVPENHTDFIFTVIGEEFGFLGGLVVLGLFAVLLWRGLVIAASARDRFGTLVAAGAVSLLVFQVFVNVGMTLGIMPVIGIPLPFVSYGGTALVATFLLVGLLLNVQLGRYRA